MGLNFVDNLGDNNLYRVTAEDLVEGGYAAMGL